MLALTDSELWRAENSFLRMRGNSNAQKGAAMLIGDPLGEGSMLALPTASSGERRTHPSALRRERHANR